MLLAPELGLVFAGGFQQGVSRVTAGGPRISLVTEDADRWREVGALAPFGVPTGPEAGAGTPERLDLVRVRLTLPGSVDASAVRVDLVSVGPGGLEIDGAGNPAQILDLPPTSLPDLELRRQGADPTQSGSRRRPRAPNARRPRSPRCHGIGMPRSPWKRSRTSRAAMKEPT